MTVAVLVPRRPDGGARDELWAFCERWWAEHFPAWPITTADVPGTFNRGAAINAAATEADDWDIALIADGDVVADPAQVQAAIDNARTTGRATFAFTHYRGLDEPMTRRVIDGFDGDWSRGARVKMESHVSSLIAVPRKLWDDVGGFDPRCEGWGHDDLIFAHCCRVLGGGCDRIPGTVWHLWHPVSPHRAATDPGNRAAGLLGQRYYREHRPEGVHALIAERSDPGAALVVLTHGRRSCIESTIPSAIENLKGIPVGSLIISDDSADPEYQAWLRWSFPSAEVATRGKRDRPGFAGNVRRAWDAAIAAGREWVFWLEDDFTFNEPIDLAAMADVLTAHPHLTQMVVRRQPWFPPEVAAGGIIDADPDAHVDATDGVNEWVEHELGHWTNPHLVSRRFLAEHTWPTGHGSERRFSDAVIRGGRRSAYWGPRDAPPMVEHFGERDGTGY